MGETVKCPWCDDEWTLMPEGVLRAHMECYPDRWCEGSGRHHECQAAGCTNAPVTERPHDYCDQHRHLAKASG
jgi:hypothetical protein